MASLRSLETPPLPLSILASPLGSALLSRDPASGQHPSKLRSRPWSMNAVFRSVMVLCTCSGPPGVGACWDLATHHRRPHTPAIGEALPSTVFCNAILLLGHGQIRLQQGRFLELISSEHCKDLVI